MLPGGHMKVVERCFDNAENELSHRSADSPYILLQVIFSLSELPLSYL